MSDEGKEKEPKPTSKFGSVKRQFETIGGGKGDSTMQGEGTLTLKRPDVKTSPAPEEMKRQTIYLPRRLATWLKMHAASTEDDMSAIITGLVEELKDKVEKGQRTE